MYVIGAEGECMFEIIDKSVSGIKKVFTSEVCVHCFVVVAPKSHRITV